MGTDGEFRNISGKCIFYNLERKKVSWDCNNKIHCLESCSEGYLNAWTLLDFSVALMGTNGQLHNYSPKCTSYIVERKRMSGVKIWSYRAMAAWEPDPRVSPLAARRCFWSHADPIPADNGYSRRPKSPGILATSWLQGSSPTQFREPPRDWPALFAGSAMPPHVASLACGCPNTWRCPRSLGRAGMCSGTGFGGSWSDGSVELRWCCKEVAVTKFPNIVLVGLATS